jgi:Protein of unknown function (DUF3455)
VVFDAAANPVLHEENEVKNDYVREWMSGAFAYRLVRKVIGALTVLACCGAVHAEANGQERKAELDLRGVIVSPVTPETITPPVGNVAYLHGLGVGTQGYVCLPTANGGVSWTVNNARPEATLFTKIFGEAVQIITHFLSPVENPNGVGPHPSRFGDVTWQSSFDSSRVWAQKDHFIAAGTDLNSCPNTGSIDCLLLQVIGADEGPTGGKLLTKTTYIQRLNTKGGSAPTNSCLSPSEIGKQILVPYSADYFFFRAEQ